MSFFKNWYSKSPKTIRNDSRRLLFETLEDRLAPASLVFSSPTINITEGGASVTYTVGLDATPTFPVAVAVNVGDVQLGVSPTALSFNSTATQTVTVTIANDSIAQGTRASVINHTTSSTDPLFNLLTGSIDANITDNDTAGVTITETLGSTAVTEAGGTDTYSIVLTSQPTSSVTVSIAGDTQVGVAPTSLLFTAANWNVAQVVTASSVADFVAEGNHTGVINHTATSSDPNYVLANTQIAKITASVTDNDTVGVNIGALVGVVTEAGGTGTYTVSLNSQPSGPVTISVAVPNGQATASPSILTFTTTNFATPQTVTITAVNDFLQEGAHSAILTNSATSSDAQYNNLTGIASVTAPITDNDTAGATITAPGGVKEAGATSSTYTVVLVTIPADTVIITLVNNDGQVSVSPTSLTFTPSDWYLPQTVTVTAIDDQVDEGPAATHNGLVNYIVSSPGDPNYHNNASINTFTTTVAVTENDVAGVTVSRTAVGIAEGSGNTETYTIVLNTKPVSAVTITVTPALTDFSAPVAGTIVFDSTNWNVPRVISVAATDDLLYESTETRNITHAVNIGSDARYLGVAIATVTADITDNDAPGVIISEVGGTTVTEGGATDTISVVLNSQIQTTNVLVTLNAGSQLTLAPLGPLTFTPGNWNVPQIIVVTANNDGIVEGAHSGTIQYTTSATPADNPGYNGIATTASNVTIIDNAVATPIGLVLNKTSISVVEDGATDTFSVVLNLRPIDDVNVAINPGQAQLSTDPTTLNFTTSNWNVPQIITVAAIDDFIAQVSHAGSVNLAATSLDPNYSGKGGTVTVTVGDPNNRAPVNSVPSVAQSIAEDNATPLTFNAANDNLISITDIDAGTRSIQVTVAVSNGVLDLATPFPASIVFSNGDGIDDLTTTFTGNLTDVNFVLNAMTYQPKPSFFGSDTLTITTNDLGNSGPGGAKSDTDTVAITVISVSDGPDITVPPAQTTNEDTAKVFSVANGNAISFTDSDVPTGTVTATLSVTNGTLTLSNTGSLSFASGDGTADGSMTFTGTVARINTVLAGLKYAPTADFNGSDTLLVSIDDGSMVGSRSVDINVVAVNDRPSVTLDTTAVKVWAGSGAQTFPGFVSAFTPGPDDEIAQTAVAYTTPKVSNTTLFSVQPAVSTAGDLTFTVAPGKSGTTTVDLVVQDSGGGVDKSVVKVFTITISNTISYIDEDGDKYTVTLKGPGNLTVVLDDVLGDGTGAIQSISVKDTDQTSSLVIGVTKAGAGDGFVNVGTIQNPDDTLGSGIGIIAAPGANLVDGGINISGLVGSITVNNITNGADVNTGLPGTLTPAQKAVKTTVVAKAIGDGSDFTVANTLNLAATSFAVGTITAPAMGTLTINGIFSASNVTLAGINATTVSLGAATIAGDMASGSLWDITGRAGKITLKGNVTDWSLLVKNTGGATPATAPGQNGTITDGDGKLDGLSITGHVTKAILDVAETVGAVSAKSWSDGEITAESVASLTTTTGNFLAPLTLTSTSDTVPALGKTTIAGNVTSAAAIPTFLVNDVAGIALGALTITVDTGTGRIPSTVTDGATAAARFAINGTVHTIASTVEDGSGNTTSITFTPALTIPLADNTALSLFNKLTWTISGFTNDITVKGTSTFWDLIVDTDDVRNNGSTQKIGNVTLGDVNYSTLRTDSSIAKVQANSFTRGSIVAGSIGTAGLTTVGDFTGDLTLSSAITAPNVNVLPKAIIGGNVTGNAANDVDWTIPSGFIGNITVKGASSYFDISAATTVTQAVTTTAASIIGATTLAITAPGFAIPVGTPFTVDGDPAVHTVTTAVLATGTTLNFLPALTAATTNPAVVTLLFGKATNVVLGTVTNSTITADQNIALVQATSWTRNEVPTAFTVDNGAGYPIGTATMTIADGTGLIGVGATFRHNGTTHTVTSSSPATGNTTSITFTPVLTSAYADNAAVNATAPIGVDITAGSIKSLNITGTGIFGSLNSADPFDVVLNGAGLTAASGAASNILNSAFIGGTVTNTKFDLHGRSAGGVGATAAVPNVGTFTAGGFDTSKLYLGVASAASATNTLDPTNAIFTDANITNGLTIATFTIKGTYANSLVVADILGKVTVNTLATATPALPTYGFVADTRINNFKSTTPSFAQALIVADLTIPTTSVVINIV